MSSYFLLLPILIPILSGILLFLMKPKTHKARNIFVFSAVLINSIVTAIILFFSPRDALYLVEIVENVDIVLRLDGLGTVFAAIILCLWPLATLYAFDYMKKYSNLNMFFAFYVMTSGVTMGLAFSGNALTMYLFYEFLTLVTTPLVLHTQSREAVVAARKYLYYSITGAAIGFIAVVFVLVYGQNALFSFGGIIDLSNANFDQNIMLFVYVLSFMGFGVKAAVFPFHGWLPAVSVAPTPVTALLHAVAVVKAGVFVIMRSTYYVFGTELLEGSWAQLVVMMVAAVTVVYASVMAFKEQKFKRRLAYSTISNLSYILLGVSLMSNLGLFAALIHMVFHAVMKISAFSCAGAVIERAKITYVSDLNGMGRKMPFTFVCFAVSSLSLMGMPILIGFTSKYYLITAAIESGNVLGSLLIIALFLSSVFVVGYLIVILVKAFFPTSGVPVKKGKDPGMLMKLPLAIYTVFIIVVGVYAEPIVNYLLNVSNGIL